MAREKHENSYGEYFLFDTFEGSPVYQHFAGIEYLYKRDGHWLVSDKIGLHEAGMQNQVNIDNTQDRKIEEKSVSLPKRLDYKENFRFCMFEPQELISILSKPHNLQAYT